MSVRVVDALAADADVEAVALQPPLYDAIDPEALDRLYRKTPPSRLEFEYDGIPVVIEGDGTISVDGTAYNPPDTGEQS